MSKDNLANTFPSNPRVAIVGCGAIGCYYGTLLASTGLDIHFLVRSNYETVKANGITIKGSEGEVIRHDVNVYKNAESIGPCDLVIIAAKSFANPQLVQTINPLINNQSSILTLQNGLGNVEFFAKQFGDTTTLGGLCFICLNRTAPGIVENYYPGYISIGEASGQKTQRAAMITSLFEKAGVKTILSESLDEALWRKLFWNIPFNGLSISCGGITTDKILANPEWKKLARDLMVEVQNAAAAHGYDIPNEFIDRQFTQTEPMGPYKPSSLIDYLENREVEVEAIFGEPLHRAQKLGVPMPKLQALYEKLNELLKLKTSEHPN